MSQKRCLPFLLITKYREMKMEMEITQSIYSYYDEDTDEIHFDAESMIEEFQEKIGMLIEMELFTKEEMKEHHGF